MYTNLFLIDVDLLFSLMCLSILPSPSHTSQYCLKHRPTILLTTSSTITAIHYQTMVVNKRCRFDNETTYRRYLPDVKQLLSSSSSSSSSLRNYTDFTWSLYIFGRISWMHLDDQSSFTAFRGFPRSRTNKSIVIESTSRRRIYFFLPNVQVKPF